MLIRGQDYINKGIRVKIMLTKVKIMLKAKVITG